MKSVNTFSTLIISKMGEAGIGSSVFIRLFLCFSDLLAVNLVKELSG